MGNKEVSLLEKFPGGFISRRFYPGGLFPGWLILYPITWLSSLRLNDISEVTKEFSVTIHYVYQDVWYTYSIDNSDKCKNVFVLSCLVDDYYKGLRIIAR